MSKAKKQPVQTTAASKNVGMPKDENKGEIDMSTVKRLLSYVLRYKGRVDIDKVS